MTLGVGDARAVLDAQYDLGSDSIELEYVDRESVNAVFLVRTDGEPAYALKGLGRPTTDEWLRFQWDWIGRFHEAGLPVPPLVATVDGRGWATCGDGVADTVTTWQLWRAAAGEPFEAGSVAHVRAAARFLDQLHALPGQPGSTPASPGSDVSPYLADPALPDQLERALAGVDAPAAVVARAWERYAETIEEFVDRVGAERYASLPASLTHGEFIGSNLLFRDGEVSGAIDWDALERRPRIYDVVKGALFLARRARGSFAVHPDLAAEFLSAVSAALPISADEQACAPYIAAMTFVPTPAFIETWRARRPDQLEWYLGWTADGTIAAAEVIRNAFAATDRPG